MSSLLKSPITGGDHEEVIYSYSIIVGMRCNYFGLQQHQYHNTRCHRSWDDSTGFQFTRGNKTGQHNSDNDDHLLRARFHSRCHG
jgi:hypothetical protein